MQSIYYIFYVYNSSEKDFSRNGLGYLSDCLSAQVTESLNGDYVYIHVINYNTDSVYIQSEEIQKQMEENMKNDGK